MKVGDVVDYFWHGEIKTGVVVYLDNAKVEVI